jgi:hypothetical protein
MNEKKKNDVSPHEWMDQTKAEHASQQISNSSHGTSMQRNRPGSVRTF